MTKEEFIRKMKEDHEWAPGWDAIEEVFSGLYPDQEPSHYGTLLHSRAMFGGDNYLDGYSIYDSAKGYKHIVTFGMTELYADEKAFGGEWNKWGYEMTIKLRADSAEDCMWALDMLSNLARYTYTKERFFEPLQYVAGNGTPLRIGSDSQITALLTMSDTEAMPIDTVYGKTEFIQLVGITQKELEAIMNDHSRVQELVDRLREQSPDLVTDMSRTV